MEHKLSKIKQIDLRKAWNHEAYSMQEKIYENIFVRISL